MPYDKSDEYQIEKQKATWKRQSEDRASQARTLENERLIKEKEELLKKESEIEKK